MLTLLKLTRSIYNAVAGAASPTQVALAVAIGILLAVLPLGITRPQTYALVMLALFTRASFGIVLLTAGLVKPLMLAGGDAALAATGRFALENVGAVRAFAARGTDLPVLSLMDLTDHRVMGGLLLGTMAAVAAFVPVRQGVVYFRTHVQPRAEQYRVVRWWRGFFLTRALSYIFVGDRKV